MSRAVLVGGEQVKLVMADQVSLCRKDGNIILIIWHKDRGGGVGLEPT